MQRPTKVRQFSGKQPYGRDTGILSTTALSACLPLSYTLRFGSKTMKAKLQLRQLQPCETSEQP